MSMKFFTNCNVVDVVNEKVFAGSVLVEDSVIKEVGENLSCPEGIIAESERNATSLFGSRHTFYSTGGSSQCVKAMLLVKGGEINGKMVMALMAKLSQVGRFKRVVTKAKINPKTVPAAPTEQPKRILLTAERLSYQLSINGRRLSRVKLPSTQKVVAKSRQSG